MTPMRWVTSSAVIVAAAWLAEPRVCADREEAASTSDTSSRLRMRILLFRWGERGMRTAPP